jgi:hypothetical protein
MFVEGSRIPTGQINLVTLYRGTFLTKLSGFIQERMQVAFTGVDHSQGIQTGMEESSGMGGPGIGECLANTGEITIDDRTNAEFLRCNFLFQALPLPGKSLNSVEFGWRKVYLDQVLWVDEWHLGQSDGINFITLRVTAEVLAQGDHFLSLDSDQMAGRMLAFEVESYSEPVQTRCFKDNRRISPVFENALFQLLQIFRGSLETETITEPGVLVQAPHLVIANPGQIDTHTFDHVYLSSLLNFRFRGHEPVFLFPC